MMAHEAYLVLCRNHDNGGEARIAGRYPTAQAAEQAAQHFARNAEKFGKRLTYYVVPEHELPPALRLENNGPSFPES